MGRDPGRGDQAAPRRRATPTPATPITGIGSPRSKRIVAEKGAADPAALARYRTAWQRAARRTPHGAPIALAPEDFARD